MIVIYFRLLLELNLVFQSCQRLIATSHLPPRLYLIGILKEWSDSTDIHSF
jgi:hypothetical protein